MRDVMTAIYYIAKLLIEFVNIHKNDRPNLRK